LVGWFFGRVGSLFSLFWSELSHPIHPFIHPHAGVYTVRLQLTSALGGKKNGFVVGGNHRGPTAIGTIGRFDSGRGIVTEVGICMVVYRLVRSNVWAAKGLTFMAAHSES